MSDKGRMRPREVAAAAHLLYDLLDLGVQLGIGHGHVELLGAHQEQLGAYCLLAGALVVDAPAADLLVLPSRRLANGDRDGIPNAVLEAMALGVPVVTTDAGAAGEVVADGATGLLLPSPATPEALASAIARLARDGALRATLSRNAAALVRERFTAAGYLDAVSNCLQSANSSSIILP